MKREIVFTFTDTHNAMRAERTLEKAQLSVRVMPRPSSLGRGCGICLRVDEALRDEAEAVLCRSAVLVEAVYARTKENSNVRYDPV